MKKYFKRRLGDRYDGWRVRDIDNIYTMVPFLLRTRIDSQCFFEEEIELEPLEDFVKKHRDEIPGLTILHVVIAIMVRAISQRPYINRFIVYNKLYAHNDIRISLMIKRTMGDRGEETPIMPVFDPFDTLADVVRKITDEIDQNKETDEKNSTDKTARFLGNLPPFLLRIVVFFVRWLDNIGLLPKGVHGASPYHCSAFITNVGSLGIGPIYHHLYEFGTCSFFVAMGKKVKREGVDKDAKPIQHRTIGFKFVVDERVCDGHYYALTMRYMRKLLNNPTPLLSPPPKVVLDDGIGRPPVYDPNIERGV